MGFISTRVSRTSRVSVQSMYWEHWSRSWITLDTPHTLLLQYSHSALPVGHNGSWQWHWHVGVKPHGAASVPLTHNFLSQLLPHPGMQQVMRQLLQLSHVCQSRSKPQGLGWDLWHQRTNHNAV